MTDVSFGRNVIRCNTVSQLHWCWISFSCSQWVIVVLGRIVWVFLLLYPHHNPCTFLSWNFITIMEIFQPLLLYVLFSFVFSFRNSSWMCFGISQLSSMILNISFIFFIYSSFGAVLCNFFYLLIDSSFISYSTWVFLRFYLLIHERHRERSRLHAGSQMWGSIPGPWDHVLSQRQTLNHWATMHLWS